ncbi:putative Lipoprotein [Syntrophobacter sp. SbD2]|nr:putative Lipoprotein [Syntrophobacter sp. SbD2]
MAVVCICLVTACGCSRSSAPPPPPPGQSQPAPYAGPAPVYGPSASSVPASPSLPGGAKFLDFNDIPIPREISVQPNHSYVFTSGQMKMGFLTLRGRVDSNSLMNFFALALPHEGWRLKAQFRYNRSLLIFDKPDKVCVIVMKEESFYTYVEIYVSPVAPG